MTLSPRAAYMMGSTAAYLAPFLAQDKKMPDLVPIFSKVTTKKTWTDNQKSIEAALTRAFTPLMAQDAEVHIHEHLDGAGAGAPPDNLMAGPPAGAPDAGGGLAMTGAAAEGSGAAPPVVDPNAPGAGDDDLAAKVQQLLQGQIDDNDLAIIMHALKQVKPPAPDPSTPAADPTADPAKKPEGDSARRGRPGRCREQARRSRNEGHTRDGYKARHQSRDGRGDQESDRGHHGAAQRP